MNRLEKAILELQKAVKESSYYTTTIFSVHITGRGYKIDIENRTPEGLRKDGVSMRNIKGDFIK